MYLSRLVRGQALAACLCLTRLRNSMSFLLSLLLLLFDWCCSLPATAPALAATAASTASGASSGGASGYTITSQRGPAGSHDLPNRSTYSTGGDVPSAVAAAVASRPPASQPHQQQQGSQQQQGRGAGRPSVSTAAQPNMQHLLLDAVATGLATTGQTILQLLQ